MEDVASRIRERANDSRSTEVHARHVHAPAWLWSLAGWTVVVIVVLMFGLAAVFG
jgi:hypothetical protein